MKNIILIALVSSLVVGCGGSSKSKSGTSSPSSSSPASSSSSSLSSAPVSSSSSSVPVGGSSSSDASNGVDQEFVDQYFAKTFDHLNRIVLGDNSANAIVIDLKADFNSRTLTPVVYDYANDRAGSFQSCFYENSASTPMYRVSGVTLTFQNPTSIDQRAAIFTGSFGASPIELHVNVSTGVIELVTIGGETTAAFNSAIYSVYDKSDYLNNKCEYAVADYLYIEKNLSKSDIFGFYKLDSTVDGLNYISYMGLSTDGFFTIMDYNNDEWSKSFAEEPFDCTWSNAIKLNKSLDQKRLMVDQATGEVFAELPNGRLIIAIDSSKKFKGFIPVINGQRLAQVSEYRDAANDIHFNFSDKSANEIADRYALVGAGRACEIALTKPR